MLSCKSRPEFSIGASSSGIGPLGKLAVVERLMLSRLPACKTLVDLNFLIDALALHSTGLRCKFSEGAALEKMHVSDLLVQVVQGYFPLHYKGRANS